MDQGLRNKLRNVVTQCRKLLEEAVSHELQARFGLHTSPKKDEVVIEDETRMTHLSDEERAYRKDLIDHYEHIRAFGSKPKDALAQLIREIAFTHLNRLCAYKMMEAREVYVGDQRFREAVSRGVNSNGVKFFLADHPDDERLFNTGHQDVAYHHFLDWLGGLLSEEIGILFNPNDPANRLYPPQRVLDDVLDLINDEKLAEIWTQDETIGWVYQYFTPKELRDQARKESAAPRNSYELAFRNQFFTPRYVVEFLTDNTLGRIWYEMRRGETILRDQCRYMVRRSTEIFLAEGQQPPKDTGEDPDDLSQEELLKQSVYIPHRSKRDPRELKILDPACGSGHFLLYSFDLLLTIYLEAYSDSDLGPALQKDYLTLKDLRKAIPGLILKHNLHGIDIDLRATQIAALALWLRCQRAYQEIGLKRDRPKITRSNIVCAEPMPGEQRMLKEFVAKLEPKLLSQLVEVVFDKMRLAGEAGSLLRIEEEIQGAVAEAKRQYQMGGLPVQQSLFDPDAIPVETKHFDVRSLTDDQFFEQAESKVAEALKSYAEQAHNGQQLLRRLFTEDAVRGFAFIELCHKRFDVVLMNPPFGALSKPSKGYVEHEYALSKNDLYAAFIERGVSNLVGTGLLGAITSRTGYFLTSFQKWREEILLGKALPTVFADLGFGVLDAAVVETAAFCLAKNQGVRNRKSEECVFFRLLGHDEKAGRLADVIKELRSGLHEHDDVFAVTPNSFRQVPGSPFTFWVSDRIRRLFSTLPPFDSEDVGRATRCGLGTLDDFRFLRLRWEIDPSRIGHQWKVYYHGGVFSPFYDEFPLVVLWSNGGEEIKRYVEEKVGSASRKVQGEDHYFKTGFVFPRRTKGFSPRFMPADGIFSTGGQAGFVPTSDLRWTVSLLSSRICTFLLSLSQGRTGDAAQFEVGLVKRLPWPTPDPTSRLTLSGLADVSFDCKCNLDAVNETSHMFLLPSVLFQWDASLSESIRIWHRHVAAENSRVGECQSKIDEIGYQVFAIHGEDRRTIESDLHPSIAEGNTDEECDDDDEREQGDIVPQDGCSPVRDLLSYCLGCVIGRWDVRLVAGREWRRDTPDPLAPLPVCSPGSLRESDGLPATTTPENYPLCIDWDGILVDDPDHPDDILRRVREVLEVIWRDRADAIEKEACEILSVKDLRDYFRKPGKGGFWDDHVSRYSKSRRKAPIYWLLQSSKKNYALWIYYHRLDKDILFKALLNYIEPKIRLEESRLDSLRSQKQAGGVSGKAAKKVDQDIERQDDLLSELHDFEDKLRRAANLHLEPDLNDGVVLNIAPLHELVPWKEAKSYWDELLAGKYEWSSIGKQLREKGIVK